MERINLYSFDGTNMLADLTTLVPSDLDIIGEATDFSAEYAVTSPETDVTSIYIQYSEIDGALILDYVQALDAAADPKYIIWDTDVSLSSFRELGGAAFFSNDDLITGWSDDDTLVGGSGDDTLQGGWGSDMIFGGDGSDIAVYEDLFDDVTVTLLNDGIVQIQVDDRVDTVHDVEAFEFADITKTYDELVADEKAEDDEAASEQPGDDEQSDVEEVTYGANGEVYGTSLDDAVLEGSSFNDVIFGFDGDDGIRAFGGDDEILGGAGHDTVSASDGDDTVDGEAGDDFIGGGEGDDSLLGGTGDDIIGAGFGDDFVAGGAGDDVVAGGAGADVLRGDAGNDTMGGSYNHDTLHGNTGDDSLGGGFGKDEIMAGAGDDAVGGGEGDDTIYGQEGDDFLAGGGRNDLILGGDGDDIINGGSGSDEMAGGAGSDVFVFNGSTGGDLDIIRDFEDGDLLRLSGVENAPGTGLEGRVEALDATAAIVDGVDGTMLTYGGSDIFLMGLTENQLGIDDFSFI